MEQDKWLYLFRSNFYHLDPNIQESTYQSYRKLVYHDIYFLFRNHDLAEDIVQE